MSKIVVTGGAGRLGRLVVDRLAAAGHCVTAVDVAPTPENCAVRYVQADLTQPSEAHDALRGADALVHLAAVPGPQAKPESVIFDTNVRSTYHLAEAAVAQRLERIVFASSLFTLGWHPAPDVYWPAYVPVDEAHPTTPFEAYGLSKVIGEEICAAACRRSGMAAVSLRITNVIQIDGYGALPWPTPTPAAGVRFPLWPYIDVRDAANACCLALSANITGHEPLYIAASDTRFDAPTEALLQQLAPQVALRRPLPGRASVIDCGKAADLLGYTPQHHWATEQQQQ